MTPEEIEAARVEAAKLDEANALVDLLRTRTVALNVEIRNRDAQIAHLAQQLAALQSAPAEQPAC